MKIKKILAVVLAATTLFACAGCGNSTNKDLWRKEAANQVAEKIDTKDLGKVYIEGTVYTFPMKLTDLTNNGWHIAKSYNNVDEFKLDQLYESEEFEIFSDNTKKSLSIKVYNIEAEPVSVYDCVVTYIGVNYDNVDQVMLPGGIAKNSKKDEVKESLSNLSSDEYVIDEDKDTITVTGIASKDWDVSITYSFITDTSKSILKSVKLAVPEESDSWGTNSSFGQITDMKEYLDASFNYYYHGVEEGYIGTYVYEQDLNATFDDMKKSAANHYKEYMGIDAEDENYPEAQKTYLSIIGREVLESSSWEIVVNGDKAEITVCSTDLAEVSYDELSAVYDKHSAILAEVDKDSITEEEYNKYMRDLNQDLITALYKCKDKATANVVNKGTFTLSSTGLSNEDWYTIDLMIMGLYEDNVE